MKTIYVATSGGLFELPGSSLRAFEGRRVNALSADGASAIVDGRELWARTQSWSQVATSDLDLTCVLPLEQGAIAGTEEAHLLRLDGESLDVVGAFEDAAGRDEWFTPWGGPPAVRSMARLDADVFVNVHVGGIVRGDVGSRWEPTIDISADVHEVRADGDVVMAACAVGYAQTRDLGETWNFDDEGLHATYARALAAGRRFIFMSVSYGPRGGDAAIYRKRRDRSGTFARCDLPSFDHNIDTGCLDANDDLVAFGTRDGNAFASTDDGATWDRLGSGLPPIHHLVVER